MPRPKKKQARRSAAPRKRSNRPRTPTLTERVRALEVHVAAVGAIGQFRAAEAVGVDAVVAEDARPLIFSLGSGGPKTVRLTLNSVEQLILGSAPVQSLPRANGALVSVLIELWGNPGQQASIGVGNGLPQTMTSSIPADRSDWAEPRTVLAKW